MNKYKVDENVEARKKEHAGKIRTDQICVFA